MPKPVLMPPELHSNWLTCEPVPFCSPIVAESPVLFIVPYTKSITFDVSCIRISMLAVDVAAAKYTARHSMLNMRFGALPLIDVKIPQPLENDAQPAPTWSVLRSSQNGAIRSVIVGSGRHALVNAVFVDVNCMLPFDTTLAFVKLVP
jgi:hypothetical protein